VKSSCARLIAATIIAACSWSPAVFAEESGGAPQAATAGDAANNDAAQKPLRKIKRMPVIKDAEGTEAPNRFQAETIIKSGYSLEGKKLEVDPD